VKFIPDGEVQGMQIPVLELTRRNLEGLLAKLGDPNSARTLIDPSNTIAVRAVNDSEHYKTRDAGPMMTKGRYH